MSVAGRMVAWRGHGKTASRISPTPAAIQLYFRKDELGDARFARSSSTTSATSSACAGRCCGRGPARSPCAWRRWRCSRSRCGRCRSARKRSSTAQIVRHSGFADPEQRYRQRYADLAVHPEVRALFVARSRMITAIRAFLDGARISSRSRRRCCSRCTAARRRGRSRRTTTRSTCRSSCASRTSCISSGSSWAASIACTRSGTTSGTRGSTARTIPSSRCSSSTRRTPTTRR